jgi:hypothetical protein
VSPIWLKEFVTISKGKLEEKVIVLTNKDNKQDKNTSKLIKP